MAIERTLSQRRVYDGRILNVRVDEAILPNGKTVTREVIEHHGACGIVAFDEEGKLLMVRQYRYPMACELLELPAGRSTSIRTNSSMYCMSISTRRSAGFSPGSCPTPRPRSES